jgi:hypothetical protein
MKYILLLGTLFVAWVILCLADLRCVDEGRSRVKPRIPNYSWSEMSEIFAREQELDEELRQIQLFRKNQSAIEEDVRSERRSLQRAAAMLDTQARDNYPLLREMLGDRYPALSSEERMALHLLQHLEANGCQPEVIERMCREMATWSKADPTLFRQPRQLKPRSCPAGKAPTN